MSSQFPANFCKIYRPKLDEPFCSPHLSKQSVVSDEQKGVRVSVYSTNHTDHIGHVGTLYENFKNGLQISKYLPCLGSRSSTEKPYEWLVYHEVESCFRAFGSALLNTAAQRPNENNFVGICSRNSPAWIITQLACAAYSYVYVPIYETLGEASLQYIFSQTLLEVLVCHHAKDASYILKTLNVPHIKCVIVVTEDQSLRDLQLEFHDKVKIFYFHDFLKMGKADSKPVRPPKPDDLCSLCYTSGSTGIPKGVMITHIQYVDATRAMINAVQGKLYSQATVHMSYLPLAHVLEQLIMNFALLSGARIAFLTAGLDTIMRDLRDIKPTVFVAVPRVLSKLRSEFYKKIPKHIFLQRLIQNAVDEKNKHQTNGAFKSGGFVDYFIFSKMRQAFGDRICTILCGGAPLLPDIARFYRAVFNCPVIEGYGSTETTGLLTATLYGETECAVVGALTTGVELRLADVPEMGISVARDGVGEICVRGLRITKGYFKDPENTAKLFDSDGWLHIGDIGCWTPTGALKIVDRCKNMFKLAQGEYVAAEKVENVYQCSPLVLHILIDGDSTRQFAVAVVHPDFAALRNELNSTDLAMGVVHLSDEQLCEDINIRKFVLGRMNAIAQERGLKSLEMAKSVYLTTEPFTIKNGLLTPTLKISRYRAREVYKEIVAKLYDNGELIIGK